MRENQLYVGELGAYLLQQVHATCCRECSQFTCSTAQTERERTGIEVVKTQSAERGHERVEVGVGEAHFVAAEKFEDLLAVALAGRGVGVHPVVEVGVEGAPRQREHEGGSG